MCTHNNDEVEAENDHDMKMGAVMRAKMEITITK
jgi:hypothetical protein